MSDDLEKWRSENREEIEKVWKEASQYGFAVYCPECGAESINSCECAHQRFLNNITPNKFETYRKMVFGEYEPIEDLNSSCEPIEDLSLSCEPIGVLSSPCEPIENLSSQEKEIARGYLFSSVCNLDFSSLYPSYPSNI